VVNIDTGTYKRVTTLHRKLLGRYTQKLIKDKISVNQYLDFRERLDKSRTIFARTFNDVNDFAIYYVTNYPNAEIPPQKQIEHEVEHYNIGIRHGLKKMTFGLFEINDKNGTHQPIIIDHLGENCRGWTKERILAYIKESYQGVSEPSDGDRRAIDNLSKIGI